ncbi:hypothetical protein A2U01_0035375, partial [Trifolium medium]|nr:hypothetical protein [Trifolium medium]
MLSSVQPPAQLDHELHLQLAQLSSTLSSSCLAQLDHELLFQHVQ